MDTVCDDVDIHPTAAVDIDKWLVVTLRHILKPHFKLLAVHDPVCERFGCKSTWGFGNRLFVYGGSEKPREDVRLSGQNERQNIHEVRWDIDMHHPTSRKLVNETHSIFLKLQHETTTWKPAEKQTHLVKVSREYRSVIQACLMELRQTLAAVNKCGDDNQRRQLEALLELLEIVELIWSLCEILFVDTAPGGAVLSQLLDWLRLHFVEGGRMAHEAMQEERPELHPSYWSAVYSFVLQGRLEDACHLLATHSMKSSESFMLIEQIMSRMPVFSSFSGQSLAEFERSWQHWHDDCKQRLEEGHFADVPQLEIIAKILAGNEEVFVSMREQLGSWYSLLISRLLYQNPAVKAFDLQYYAQICIDIYGGQSQMQPWDNILLAALEFDIHQVIRESSSQLSNWWFVSHITDLLQHCGKLQSQTLSYGSNLREFLLLEYASSLMSHHSLWQVGVDYLDHCSEFGRYYLEQFIEHLPLETEHKAQKILRICEHRDLHEQMRSICKMMGMKALHNGRHGSALSWALRSKDVGFATYVAEKFLCEYSECGGFSHLDLIDNLGSSMLLSSKLTFLGKYREFHQLYIDGEVKEAASLLVRLLASRIAPQKFWLILLTDALPLLESNEVAFSSQQTYDLLYCLEELNVTNKLKDKEKRYQQADIQSKEMTETEQEKMNMIKLALARNLARAIVHEGTVDIN